MTIARLRVVSGSERPFIAIAFGQKVEYGRGSPVSGSQRTAFWPFVQPLLMTSLKSSFFTKLLSASSMANVGDHLAIERNSTGPVIDTLSSERLARNPMTPSNVDLPLSGSAEVASKSGLCTAAASCTQVIITHSAIATAWSGRNVTGR